MSFHKRIRRSGRDVAAVIDFTRKDKQVRHFITFSRADASPCATRRRITNSVGPSRTNLIGNSASLSGWYTTGGTPTTTTVAAPPGTSFANAFNITGGSRGASLGALVGQYTFSLWVMTASTGQVIVRRSSGAFTPMGTINATTTWQRLPVTVNLDNTTNYELHTTGDVTIVGFQMEAGAAMTPFILTAGSSVTTTDWPRTNKVTARTANPADLTGVTKTGDAAAVLSLVSEPAELAKANLSGYCTSGRVYKLDNTSGAATADATFSGTTGSTNNHTASIYARRIGAGASTRIQLNGGALGSAAITSAGYSRVSFTATSVNAASAILVRASAGDVVYFILPQLEEGSTATAVIPNDTGAALTVNTPPFGDLEVLNANEPRIDYNADGTARGLLMEPSATQLYRSTHDSSVWGYGAGIPAANRQTGFWTLDSYPATLLTCTTGQSSYGTPVGGPALTVGAAYYRSLEVKPLSTNKSVIFELLGGTTTSFNLSTMAVGAVQAGATAWIDTLADGWFRCNWLMLSATAGLTPGAFYYDSYGPAGAASQFIVGKPVLAQLSNSAVPSFITNTSGASIVRSADDAYAALSSLGWNASGWSAVVEWEQGSFASSVFGTPLLLSNDTNVQNFLRFFISPAGQLQVLVDNGGVSVTNTVGNITANSVNRLAVTLTPNYLMASLNGATAVVILGTVPMASLTRAYFGKSHSFTATHVLTGWLRRVSAWSRALTPGELAAASL